MGHRQEAWFQDKLKKSEAKWRIIGNQVLFSRLENKLNIYPEESEIFMHDSWEGYLAHKNRTLQTLYDNKIGNNIFLAGDSHSAWVSDIVWLGDKSYDPTTGEGAIGVEFAGTAVTSPSMIGENVTMLEAKAASYGVVSQSTAIQWQDYYYRGYFELDISYEKIKAKFFGLPDIKTRNDKEIMLAEFEVLDGENHLRRNPGVAVGPINGGVLKGGEGAGSVKIMIDELAAKGSDKEAASEMMGKLKALATGEPEKESKSDPIKAAIEMLNGATLFAMESIKTVMNKVLPADT
jgi:alkaline phosphatase D